MANLLLCFSNLNNAEPLSGIWLKKAYCDQGDIFESGRFSGDAELQQLTQKFPDKEIVIFLPGEGCTTHWVVLPSKTRDSLATIPFQLETLLTESVDLLHFSPILKLECNKQFPVWVCAKNWLEGWLKRLEALNLKPVKVLPDYALLWGTLQREDTYQLRLGGRVLLSGQFNAAVPESYMETFYTQGDLGRVKDVELSEVNLDFISSFNANILQGEYKRKRQVKGASIWKICAVSVLLVLMLVNLLLGQFKIEGLNEQLQVLDKQIEASFSSAMPGNRMVDPLFQMEREYDARLLATQSPEILQALHLVVSQLGSTDQRQVSKIFYSSDLKELNIYHRGSPIILPKGGGKFSITQSIKKEVNHVTINW